MAISVEISEKKKERLVVVIIIISEVPFFTGYTKGF
jgi:hypothetical protein